MDVESSVDKPEGTEVVTDDGGSSENLPVNEGVAPGDQGGTDVVDMTKERPLQRCMYFQFQY